MTHVISIKIDSRKREAALITAVTMQALRCLLRSKQDHGGRSISAALQRSSALSFTACDALEAANVGSKITTGITSLGFHTADSSFSILSQQLEGFAQLKAQASGSGLPGRACIGKRLRASCISGSILPCHSVSCRHFGVAEAMLQQHAQNPRHCNAARPAGAVLCNKKLSHLVDVMNPIVHMQSLGDTGWTRKNVYNVPNAISMARLASGPVIAWLVLSEQWGVALVSLAISGASDWADG